ncbi:MAG TPA: glycosyltransferase family 39 protein [Planctomycetota bacterium]|jgi:4-amino-4-deoxy-L-arabinose transferase-like glycosyltransferase|nr:glycosyltransferase family 39 protein [Planctomycetota bacterium]
MRKPGGRTLLGGAALLALCAALFLRDLGAIPLLDPDEPRYAGPAREMARGGDLLVPRLNGEPRLEKPILFYWLSAASLRVLGESEFAARLPSALAATATVLATAFFAARRFGARAGLLSGALLALSPQFLVLARVAVTDMTVTLFASLAFFAFDGARRGSGRCFLGCAAALGLAAATKGPPAVLPLALALGLALALRRERFPARGATLAAGATLFLGLALAWPAALRLRLGAEAWWTWAASVVGRESVGRFLGGYQHPEPPTFYLLFLAGGFFPWTLLLLGAIPAALRAARTEEPPRPSLSLLLWAGTTVLFFSLSRSKLGSYVTPAYPPLAILCGAWLAREGEGRGRLLLWRVAGACALLAFPAAFLLAPLWGRGAERDALLASPWVAVGAAGIALLGVAAGVFGRVAPALAGAALALSSLVGAVADASRVLFEEDARAAELGRRMAEAAGPDGTLVVVGKLREGLVYYADRTVAKERDLEVALRHQPQGGRLVVLVGRRRLEAAPTSLRARFREDASLERGSYGSTSILVAPPGGGD